MRDRLARKSAEEKVDKYALAAAANQATHLPFAVETVSGLSESALQLVREMHHSASTHCTWRDADAHGGTRMSLAPNCSTAWPLQCEMHRHGAEGEQGAGDGKGSGSGGGLSGVSG